MLLNYIASFSRIKSDKAITKKLKTHRGDPLHYEKLLKLAAQHYDQTNRANLHRSTLKVCDHDLVLELTETSNSSEEAYNVDSPTTVLMEIVMSRKKNNNKFNRNSNKK